MLDQFPALTQLQNDYVECIFDLSPLISYLLINRHLIFKAFELNQILMRNRLEYFNLLGKAILNVVLQSAIRVNFDGNELSALDLFPQVNLRGSTFA